MYSCGQWCGAWLAPGQNHMNHGRDGARRLDVADHLDRLVGQVLREVVALLRGVRLVDVVVVDRGRDTTGWSRRRGSRRSDRSPGAAASSPCVAPAWRSSTGTLWFLPSQNVLQPACPQHLGQRAALRRDARVRRPGSRSQPSVMQAMPFWWWLRPVRKHERVGEQSAVVCHCEYVRPLSASRCSVGMLMRPPNGDHAARPVSS